MWINRWVCFHHIYIVYLLDMLVESHTAQLLLDYYYCTSIEVSVLRGGGGEQFIMFFTTIFFLSKNALGSCNAKRKQIWGGGAKKVFFATNFFF